MVVKRLNMIYILISYKLWSWAVEINHRVPHSMQVLGAFVIRNLNKVASSISLWILRVNSANRMQRLMDVTYEMNQKSNRIGKSFFIWKMRQLLHHRSIDKAILVFTSFREPIYQSRDYHVYWVLIELELRVVLNRITFIQVRSVDKMPSRLESASFALDLIGKSGAFNKRIRTFMRGHALIGWGIDLEQIVNLFQGSLPLCRWL